MKECYEKEMKWKENWNRGGKNMKKKKREETAVEEIVRKMENRRSENRRERKKKGTGEEIKVREWGDKKIIECNEEERYAKNWGRESLKKEKENGNIKYK